LLVVFPAAAAASGDKIAKRPASQPVFEDAKMIANVRGADPDTVRRAFYDPDVLKQISQCGTPDRTVILRVSLWTRADGRIRKAVVSNTGRSARAKAQLRRCIARVARGQRFSKQPRRRRLSFDLLLTRPQPIIGGGSLPKEIIRKVIRSHIDEVKSCYERHLVKNATAQGRIDVQFTIDATGKVVAAKVFRSDLKSQTLEQCVISTIRKWVFPKPKGGGIVIVTYPFVLRTAP
jgi:TonB family protein